MHPTLRWEDKKKASGDWLTPPAVIERLGPFDLDPCASVKQPWRTAKTMYTIEDDGFNQDWFGYVFVNPPFSQCRRWVTKFSEHHNGIILVPGHFSCQWFLPLWGADVLFFSHERWKFYYPVTGEICHNTWSGFVLAAFGKIATNKLKSCGLYGTVVKKEISFMSGLRLGSHGIRVVENTCVS